MCSCEVAILSANEDTGESTRSPRREDGPCDGKKIVLPIMITTTITWASANAAPGPG